MWWTGNALGFDLETDGVDLEDTRIVTAATVPVGPAMKTLEMERLLQPERDIPESASVIHGITTEQARRDGVARETGLLQIAVEIGRSCGPDVPLVGHNVAFDLTILDRELRRVGAGRLAIDRAAGHQVILTIGDETAAVFPVIDTYVLDKGVDRYRKGKRQLSIAAEHYGVPMAEGEAHGATADVYASLRIAWKIHQRGLAALDYLAQFGDPPRVFQMHPFMRHYAGRRNPLDIMTAFAAVGRLSLAELHVQQVRWAEEQARGLREHFVRNPDKGDPDEVSGAWPLRALTVTGEVETVSTLLD